VVHLIRQHSHSHSRHHTSQQPTFPTVHQLISKAQFQNINHQQTSQTITSNHQHKQNERSRTQIKPTTSKHHPQKKLTRPPNPTKKKRSRNQTNHNNAHPTHTKQSPQPSVIKPGTKHHSITHKTTTRSTPPPLPRLLRPPKTPGFISCRASLMHIMHLTCFFPSLLPHFNFSFFSRKKPAPKWDSNG